MHCNHCSNNPSLVLKPNSGTVAAAVWNFARSKRQNVVRAVSINLILITTLSCQFYTDLRCRLESDCKINDLEWPSWATSWHNAFSASTSWYRAYNVTKYSHLCDTAGFCALHYQLASLGRHTADALFLCGSWGSCSYSNNKAVLWQRRPRDALYTWMPWKTSGVPTKPTATVLFPKLLMDFCCRPNWSYENAWGSWLYGYPFLIK